MLLLPAVLSLAAAVVIHGFYPFLLLLLRQARSPLRRLPGPASPYHTATEANTWSSSLLAPFAPFAAFRWFLLGNLVEMHDMENTDLLARWQAEYGHVFVYRGFVGGCRLMLLDDLAVAHVLAHPDDYPKPDFVRDSLASMAAGHQGLLTSEGEMHRRQKKILSPAFANQHVRSLAPVFWSKAAQLRDHWLDDASRRGPHGAQLDVLGWLGQATLDVIGLAGFGYHFRSLDRTSTSIQNPLAAAFADIFSTARKFRAFTILQVWFPILRRFRPTSATERSARETMRRIGLDLIRQRERDYGGKDLLSLLIRSNQEEKAGLAMSTEEVLCQISTFIAAGHETTASALVWTLYELARRPDVQERLRNALDEIQPTPTLSNYPSETSSSPSPSPTNNSTTAWGSFSAPTSSPSSSIPYSPPPIHPILNVNHDAGVNVDVDIDIDVDACSYLDWVVRESLRLHAPVTSTMRVCTRPGGDELPVSSPYVDRTGRLRDTISLNEHDIISIPLQAMNKSKVVWGEDADVFRPERHAEDARARGGGQGTASGMWGNILTFGGGRRGCIGYRFALLEMKIFLYTLVRDLEFSLPPGVEIEKRVNVVTRPIVKGELEKGNRMPLIVRRRRPPGPPGSPGPPGPCHPSSPV